MLFLSDYLIRKTNTRTSIIEYPRLFLHVGTELCSEWKQLVEEMQLPCNAMRAGGTVEDASDTVLTVKAHDGPTAIRPHGGWFGNNLMNAFLYI